MNQTNEVIIISAGLQLACTRVCAEVSLTRPLGQLPKSEVLLVNAPDPLTSAAAAIAVPGEHLPPATSASELAALRIELSELAEGVARVSRKLPATEAAGTVGAVVQSSEQPQPTDAITAALGSGTVQRKDRHDEVDDESSPLPAEINTRDPLRTEISHRAIVL